MPWSDPIKGLSGGGAASAAGFSKRGVQNGIEATGIGGYGMGRAFQMWRKIVQGIGVGLKSKT
ncbi:hypothetical protein N7468_001601 [Penicillium chermesinum]|uniref:Uncharacterized protein n=1 Tax=Penicillium chermesinum TaxID=63820 RepID=A0A9W9PGW9_9EURO|nr:uncharacterized protein N7468_001601 [Penicillium chermesinum]KAJ5246618.1 hypothetical protein N7468_001601 [Penicillium chermesinum]KAJ6144890.1 hypothetical protein N7470_008785 [Penicillium chermesinum]